MNGNQCIAWLHQQIVTFKNNLKENETEIFKNLFKHENKENTTACIKLLCKIHKLKEKPCFSNNHLVPSRIIRGGEQYPINPYSKVLRVLLTEMLANLKNNFNQICETNQSSHL